MKLNFFYSLSAVLVAGQASAMSVEFSADFDSETPGIGVTPAGFVAVGAPIDVIGSGDNGTFEDLLPGNGYYADLAGNFGTTIETSEVFEAGSYELTFDLAGNNRQESADTVGISLGDFSETIVIAAEDFDTGFETITLAFTTVDDGALLFSNDGAEGFGALLDNVSLVSVSDGAVDGGDAVNAVPTPAALPAGILGLAALMTRRRRG